MRLTSLLPATTLALTGLAAPVSAASVYGAPPAQVIDGAHKGPPAQGDALSPLPWLRPVPAGTVHAVRLDLVNRRVPLGNGDSFDAWTFGGTMPGPTIHVRQGDRVDFTMSNRSNEATGISYPMPHSIDFHAAMVNPEDKYRTIGPGQTIRFSWTANLPGVFMYHCGTPMLLHHMCMGMYGAIVVDPEGGWPDRADREYVVVESEVFGKAMDPAHPHVLTGDVQAALDGRPAAVVFDGKVGALLDHPLKARPGDRVRFYVLNVGPADPASFHVVGTILDKVYLDGNPANLLRGMQTVLLGSSSGAVVEFVVPEAGRYPFLDHQMPHAAKGAVGYLEAEPTASAAVQVDPAPAHEACH